MGSVSIFRKISLIFTLKHSTLFWSYDIVDELIQLFLFLFSYTIQSHVMRFFYTFISKWMEPFVRMVQLYFIKSNERI